MYILIRFSYCFDLNVRDCIIKTSALYYKCQLDPFTRAPESTWDDYLTISLLKSTLLYSYEHYRCTLIVFSASYAFSEHGQIVDVIILLQENSE